MLMLIFFLTLLAYKSDIEADVHQKFDIIANIIIRLGKKFYPNEDVFPLCKFI